MCCCEQSKTLELDEQSHLFNMSFQSDAVQLDNSLDASGMKLTEMSVR